MSRVHISILSKSKYSEELEKPARQEANEILEDFDIQFRHAGDDVTIEAKYKNNGMRNFWNNIGKYLREKFILSIPFEYNVDLNTRGGSITVENLRGEV